MASINCFHLRILILEFLVLVLISICFSSLHGISDSHLSLDFYKKTCPSVEGIVRKEMECACLSDPRNAALILRLHFHDCFVQVIGEIKIFSIHLIEITELCEHLI